MNSIWGGKFLPHLAVRYVSSLPIQCQAVVVFVVWPGRELSAALTRCRDDASSSPRTARGSPQWRNNGTARMRSKEHPYSASRSPLVFEV